MQSLCGFRDAITFKEVDDTIVGIVEEYVKTELAEVLTTWTTNGIEINQEDFYGKFYVYSPKTFKFTIGDRMQIKKMVDYVKTIYDGNGIEFSGAHEFQPYASKKPKSKREKGKLARFFGENSMENPAAVSQFTEIAADDKKRVLIDKIANIYKKYGIESCLIEKLNIKLVEIHEFDEGKIRALFNCPLCDTSNKENCIVIQTKQKKIESSSSTIYWVLSNYTTHVQTHVKNSVKCVSKFEINSSKENDSAIIMIDENNPESVHASNSLANRDIIAENYDDDDENEHIVDNSIEIVEILQPQSDNELSYDDLESLIYRQITSQLNEMHEVSMKNNETEKERNFMVDGVVCTMKVNTTNPDGACFFRASDHQLNNNKLNTRKHTIGTNKLRKEVVEYIKQHRERFDSELRGSVYGWYEAMGKSTKHIDNFPKVCDDFLHKELPKVNFWAGSESLKAVTLDKSVNILVLVDNGVCYFSNGFNESFTKTIIVAFCTYSNDTKTSTEQKNKELNHYDSVVHIEPNDVFLLSKHLATIVARRRQPSPATANET